jgi:hypothetical protein
MADEQKESEGFKFEGLDVPRPTDIIWIAKDVSIHCRAEHINKVQRWFLKFLIGWRYESITKGEG